MIKEAYCSFEVSKLLREKGFNEPCGGFYTNTSVLSYTLSNATNSKWNEDKSTMGYISAPTQQMVMAWLREVHNISIEPSVVKPHYWVYTIYEILNDKVKELYNDGGFDSYEEAVEAALKYYLENLI